MMTFAEFQATREACADLGAKLKGGHWHAYPTPPNGFVYLDNLWIEEVPEHWPESARVQGRYYLWIENCEYFADQLELLECRLYVWACDSGYCDKLPPPPAEPDPLEPGPLWRALESLAQDYCHQGGDQTRHAFQEASMLLRRIRKLRGEPS